MLIGITKILSIPADTLTGVDITAPIQITGDQLPAMLNLIFGATVQTQYRSSFLGNVTYTWDFGDHSSPIMELPTTHTFNHAGHYVINLTVSNQLVSVSGSLEVNVYEGEASVLSCVLLSVTLDWCCSVYSGED